jgi:hypothetical protein
MRYGNSADLNILPARERKKRIIRKIIIIVMNYVYSSVHRRTLSVSLLVLIMALFSA